jgi:hypothetical protein
MRIQAGKKYVTRGGLTAAVQRKKSPETFLGYVHEGAGTWYGVVWDVFGNHVGEGSIIRPVKIYDLEADLGENEEVLTEDVGPDQLVEVIQNLLALVDTPMGRFKIQGTFADEVRKDAKEKLNKYLERT